MLSYAKRALRCSIGKPVMIRRDGDEQMRQIDRYRKQLNGLDELFMTNVIH